MDYINISKVLDNYMSGCHCSRGDSRDESELVRGHQFSVKNISIIIFGNVGSLIVRISFYTFTGIGNIMLYAGN